MTEADNRICPACPDGTGIPRSVKASRRIIEVTLTCNVCGHVWTTARPDQSIGQFTAIQSPDEVSAD
jgi:uncharacterized Zn finger protein